MLLMSLLLLLLPLLLPGDRLLFVGHGSSNSMHRGAVSQSIVVQLTQETKLGCDKRHSVQAFVMTSVAVGVVTLVLAYTARGWPSHMPMHP
jgi:hypothetical protein